MVLEYDLEHEKLVRAAAFGWLESQVSGEDGVVDRSVLLEGFRYQGARVTLTEVVQGDEFANCYSDF